MFEWRSNALTLPSSLRLLRRAIRIWVFDLTDACSTDSGLRAEGNRSVSLSARHARGGDRFNSSWIEVCDESAREKRVDRGPSGVDGLKCAGRVLLPRRERREVVLTPVRSGAPPEP